MNGVEYVDGYDYSSIREPLATGSERQQEELDQILDRFGFNELIHQELRDEISDHVKNEVKFSTLEFVSKFFQRMGGSKIGYSVARALGFHVFLKDKDGNEIHSLNQIAEYFGCCPQLIDQLTKQIQKDLEIEPINNLLIQKKNYSYKVESPSGFMTTGEVVDFLGISNKKLNGIIHRLGIKKRDYSRGSKLISEQDIDLVELYLMQGKESDTGEITLGDVESQGIDDGL